MEPRRNTLTQPGDGSKLSLAALAVPEQPHDLFSDLPTRDLDLRSYLNAIKAIPILAPEQERALVERKVGAATRENLALFSIPYIQIKLLETFKAIDSAQSWNNAYIRLSAFGDSTDVLRRAALSDDKRAQADAVYVERWHQRFQQTESQLRDGIAQAGKLFYARDDSPQDPKLRSERRMLLRHNAELLAALAPSEHLITSARKRLYEHSQLILSNSGKLTESAITLDQFKHAQLHPDEGIDILQLWCRGRQDRNEAINALVSHNLPFVVSQARIATREKYALLPMIQAGNYGLYRAAERVASNLETRFLTYAGYWMRVSFDNHIATIHEERRGHSAILEADLFASEDIHEQQGRGFANLLTDYRGSSPDSVLLSDEQRDLVVQAVESLSDVERKVIMHRFGLGVEFRLLKELAVELKRTASNVQQIEARALLKLRRNLKELGE